VVVNDAVLWSFDISFYINLPVGAITIATIAWLLPAPKQPLTSLPLREKLSEIDYYGAIFLVPYEATVYSG
jgi:hypothetical protein